MVASATGLLLEKGERGAAASPADLQDALAGNLCRCTGEFRPLPPLPRGWARRPVTRLADPKPAPAARTAGYLQLLEALGKVVLPAPGCEATCGHGDLPEGACGPAPCSSHDIEDLVGCCSQRAKEGLCSAPEAVPAAPFAVPGRWSAPRSLAEALEALRRPGAVAIQGGTGLKGVVKYYEEAAQCPPALSVDLRNVQELQGCSVAGGAQDRNLKIGGAATISEALAFLAEHGDLAPGNLAEAAAAFFKRVATPQVRNAGTLAGSLALAVNFRRFPSDVGLFLAMAGATATCANVATGELAAVPVTDMLLHLPSMANVLIVHFSIPAAEAPPASPPVAATFVSLNKVAKRAVNAHSIVNLGLRAGAPGEAAVLIGGLQDSGYLRPETLLRFLQERGVGGPESVEDAVACLEADLRALPACDARLKRLAAGLLRRAWLQASGALVGPLPAELQRAAFPPARAACSGAVRFEGAEDPAEFPVSAPLPKLHADLLAAGQAPFESDVAFAGGLHAAVVLAEVGCAERVSLDASAALSTPGVEAFFDASFLSARGYATDALGGEDLIAERVAYHGQVVGLVLARSPALAEAAAKAVKHKYTGVGVPLTSIDDAIAAGSYFELDPAAARLVQGDFAKAAAAADWVVSGEVRLPGQHHFHLETHTALATPTEAGGLHLRTTTQSPADVKATVADLLSIPASRVEVEIKRSGGAYGGKITRNTAFAALAAVACKAVGRPVRLALSLEQNLVAVGSRHAFKMAYTVCGKKSGELVGLKGDIYMLQGYNGDLGGVSTTVLDGIDAAYNVKSFDINFHACRTNQPVHTAMRSPGYLPGTLLMEAAIDYAGLATDGLTPEAIKRASLYRKGDFTPHGQNLKVSAAAGRRAGRSGGLTQEKKKSTARSASCGTTWRRAPGRSQCAGPPWRSSTPRTCTSSAATRSRPSSTGSGSRAS